MAYRRVAKRPSPRENSIRDLNLEVSLLEKLEEGNFRKIDHILRETPNQVMIRCLFGVADVLAIADALGIIFNGDVPNDWGRRDLLRKMREPEPIENTNSIPKNVWDRAVHDATSGAHYRKPRYRRGM